jgi:hypothetical protein
MEGMGGILQHNHKLKSTAKTMLRSTAYRDPVASCSLTSRFTPSRDILSPPVCGRNRPFASRYSNSTCAHDPMHSASRDHRNVIECAFPRDPATHHPFLTIQHPNARRVLRLPPAFSRVVRSLSLPTTHLTQREDGCLPWIPQKPCQYQVVVSSCEN